MAPPDFTAFVTSQVDVPGLGPQHDVTAISRKVIQPLLDLAEEQGMDLPYCGISQVLNKAAQLTLRNARERHQQQVKDAQGWFAYGGDAEQDKLIVREINRVFARLAVYEQAMQDCAPDSPTPEVVAGLYRSATGPVTGEDPGGTMRHFADALEPFMIDNRVSALGEAREALQAAWWKYLGESFRDLPQNLFKIAGQAADAAFEVFEDAAERFGEYTERPFRDFFKDLGTYMLWGGAALVGIAAVVYGVQSYRARQSSTIVVAPAASNPRLRNSTYIPGPYSYERFYAR